MRQVETPCGVAASESSATPISMAKPPGSRGEHGTVDWLVGTESDAVRRMELSFHALRAASRRDIDVPKAVIRKWLRAQYYEPGFRDALRRVYQYRKMVLAIFDELVLHEQRQPRLQ